MQTDRRTLGVGGMLLVGLAWSHAPAWEAARQRIEVWDTGRSAPARLAAAALAEQVGWTRRTRDQKALPFRGDAVMSNGRILAVLRKQGSAVEVYAAGATGWNARASLRLLTAGGAPAVRLEEVTVVQQTRSAARLEARYTTAAGDAVTARFRIKRGSVAVEAEPGAGAGRLVVEAPSRFVVLPDFFADDIVIDAAKIPVPVVEVPSENFVLHLTGEGDGIAMCVFENRDQDVRLTLARQDDRPVISGSEITFGTGGKIWVALLEGPGIWHTLTVEAGDAGKIMPLDWTMPFVAQWRVDFTRANDLTDSWEMLLPAKDGDGYVKPSGIPGASQSAAPSRTESGEIDEDAYRPGYPVGNRLEADRKRWTTVLGRFEYPCWRDKAGKAYVQPLAHEKLAFRGPAVIYPINRLTETPVDTYTVVDAMRDTLGVGPCQYILDVEGQKEAHVGRATCHVRRLLIEIYESKQQLSKQKEIDVYLGDALDFVTHIRSRITHYVAFGKEMRKYLAEQKKARPELAAFLTEMDAIAAELDDRIAARRERIKSPAYVAALNDDFRKTLLAYDGPDATKRLERYTDALTRLGGEQDELVGECRWIVRTLRQRAGLAMAIDPKCADVATEIRARTQKALLKPASYEGARH